MSVCHKCGAKLETGVKFCTRCGTAVQKNDELPKKGREESFNQQTLNDTNQKGTLIKRDRPKANKRRMLIIIIAAVIVLIAAAGIVTKGAAPLRAKYNTMLGNKYLEDGKYEEAIIAFQKAIQIEPKNVEARVELAKLYIKTSKPDEAEKILKEAIGINPKKMEPYLELAKLYISKNNPVNAIKILVDGYKAVGSQSIKSMLKDLESKITVDNIKKTIILGENYSLPKEVTVKINNIEVQFPIKWDISSADITKVGISEVAGTLENTGIGIKLTINVIGIASVDNINSTINQNDKYSLPSKVTAKMTDGSTREAAVAWSPSSVDTSKAGTYTYEGTVSGYDKKVKLTLNIKSLQNDDDYTPEMAIQLAKEYEGAGNSSDLAGVVYDSKYVNGKKYYLVHLYSISMRAGGGSGTVDNVWIAKDGSTISS